MGAPARGFGGRRPPAARCYRSGAEGGGFEGGRSIPSPEHSVDTLCKLAYGQVASFLWRSGAHLEILRRGPERCREPSGER